jgi:tripartite-type tricarboxylate transporter receptor subunit TctC
MPGRLRHALLAGVVIAASLFAASLFAASLSALADDYPNKPITVIVPFPAGGPTDAIIRNIGDRMRASLGQPLIVEYVSGATGTIGTARTYRAPPDGYTIICGHNGTFATNGAVYDLPYDLVTGFTPISLLPRNPYLIVVKKDLPANNLREFLAYVKANPGKVNMGHPGVGTGPHLLALQLANFVGSTMNYVPYRGSGPAMVDLVAGQIDLMVDQVQTSAAHVKGGTIKALAIAAPKRSDTVPEVPTVDEAGAPGLHMSLWYGFWAPGGTPKPIVQKLQAAVQDALADPEVRGRLTGLGMEIPPREQQTPEALTAQQKADIATWWPVIKAAGIKMQ